MTNWTDFVLETSWWSLFFITNAMGFFIYQGPQVFGESLQFQMPGGGRIAQQLKTWIWQSEQPLEAGSLFMLVMYKYCLSSYKLLNNEWINCWHLVKNIVGLNLHLYIFNPVWDDSDCHFIYWKPNIA